VQLLLALQCMSMQSSTCKISCGRIARASHVDGLCMWFGLWPNGGRAHDEDLF
jgi:hypothetical protein